jgi:feruloyl esterase
MQRDFTAIPDAPTAILSTQVVPATAQTPEYCDVRGYVTPQIQFEVQLPTQNWNRRYLQVGCGGYCGSLRASPESIAALNQNFAVAFDNTGHVGGGIGAGSALWGLDQPQLRADFGYRSEHVTSLAAKAIATAFYGKGPSYSYFQGCSNGGRQALMEAQRYPNDFNGIIAGAPAAIQAPLNGEYETWNGRANQDSQLKYRTNQCFLLSQIAPSSFAENLPSNGNGSFVFY